jgi:hypothetical protein
MARVAAKSGHAGGMAGSDRWRRAVASAHSPVAHPNQAPDPRTTPGSHLRNAGLADGWW